jgi:hypothetical protein
MNAIRIFSGNKLLSGINLIAVAPPTLPDEGLIINDQTANNRLRRYLNSNWEDLVTLSDLDDGAIPRFDASTQKWSKIHLGPDHKLLAGENILATQVVAVDRFGRAVRALASDSTKWNALGLAKSTVVADGTSQVTILNEIDVDGFTGLQVGQEYWLSPLSLGAITDQKPVGPGTVAIRIGYAVSATKLHADIQQILPQAFINLSPGTASATKKQSVSLILGASTQNIDGFKLDLTPGQWQVTLEILSQGTGEGQLFDTARSQVLDTFELHNGNQTHVAILNVAESVHLEPQFSGNGSLSGEICFTATQLKGPDGGLGSLVTVQDSNATLSQTSQRGVWFDVSQLVVPSTGIFNLSAAVQFEGLDSLDTQIVLQIVNRSQANLILAAKTVGIRSTIEGLSLDTLGVPLQGGNQIVVQARLLGSGTSSVIYKGSNYGKTQLGIQRIDGIGGLSSVGRTGIFKAASWLNNGPFHTYNIHHELATQDVLVHCYGEDGQIRNDVSIIILDSNNVRLQVVAGSQFDGRYTIAGLGNDAQKVEQCYAGYVDLTIKDPAIAVWDVDTINASNLKALGSSKVVIAKPGVYLLTSTAKGALIEFLVNGAVVYSNLDQASWPVRLQYLDEVQVRVSANIEVTSRVYFGLSLQQSTTLQTGGSGSSIETAATLPMGISSDGSYAGAVTIQNTSMTADIIDRINTVLGYMLPDAPPNLNSAVPTASFFSARISAGAVGIGSLVAGQLYTRTIKQNSLALSYPEFGPADRGTLGLVVNGSPQPAINLQSSFDEALRSTAQGSTYAGSQGLPLTSGSLTITAVHKFGSFAGYQSLLSNALVSVQPGFNQISLQQSLDSAYQSNIDCYYDNGPVPTLGAYTVTLVTPQITKKSGIPEFTLGTQINCSMAATPDLFKNTYNADGSILNLAGSAIASQVVGFTDPNLSGVSNPPNVADIASLSKNLNFTVGTVTNTPSWSVTATTPRGSSLASTCNLIKFSINTFGATSTTLQEDFNDEVYRRPSGVDLYPAIYDSVASFNSSTWDPEAPLATNELAVYQSKLNFADTNYSSYTPVGPDYSGRVGQQSYLRSFLLSTTTNAVIYVKPTTLGNCKIQIKLPGLTGWLNPLAPYMGGTPSANGDGCLVGSTSIVGSELRIPVTFGTNSTANCSSLVLVRLYGTAPISIDQIRVALA